jgi:Na+/proline symporter
LIPSSLFWASAQVRAFGRVIAWGTSLSAETGVAIAAATACAYTAFGGLLADAYADLIQGTVLCVCLLILTVTVVGDVGGVAHAGTMLIEAGRAAARQPWSWHAVNAWAVPVLGSLFAQELLSRAIAASSEQVARRSVLSAAAIYLVVGSMPLVLGAIARATLPGADPEAVLSALSQKHLGSLGYVVLTGALVSAILSTVDSALLVASSFVSHNLAPALRPGISDRQRLWVARSAVVGLACLAYGFARGQGSVHELVSQASAFGSAGICVVGAMALFTRFGGAASAYAALGLGASSWLLAEYVWELESAFLCSLAAALLGYVGAALVRPAPSPSLPESSLS